MNGLFSPNNLFFRALSWMVDIVGISLLWAILSLPVVTILPAGAALYHTVALCIRRGEDGAFGRFVRSFLQNLRQGCLLSIPAALLGVALFFGHNIMAGAAGAVGGYATMLYGIYSVALLIPAGVFCWMGPLLGRFAFGSGELCRTAVFLTLRHLPTTVFVVVVTAGAALGCLFFLPMLFILPVTAAIVVSWPMERVFRKYPA